VKPLAIISVRTGDTHATSRDLRQIAVLRVDAVTGELSDVYLARVRPVRLADYIDFVPGAVWLADAMAEVRARTRGCVLTSVDAGDIYQLLRDVCEEWELLPLEVDTDVLDLGSLAWPLVLAGEAKGIGYQELCAACDLDPRIRASALDEAGVLADLYRALVRRTAPPLELAGFSPDEQKIVATIVSRIAAGRGTYGPWHVTDGRNHPREALAEVMDALNYCAAELVRLGREGGVP
jgi:hypothetical protein